GAAGAPQRPGARLPRRDRRRAGRTRRRAPRRRAGLGRDARRRRRPGDRGGTVDRRRRRPVPALAGRDPAEAGGGVVIRPATVSDLDAIMALERASFPADAWSEAMMREELSSPHGAYFVDE